MIGTVEVGVKVPHALQCDGIECCDLLFHGEGSARVIGRVGLELAEEGLLGQHLGL